MQELITRAKELLADGTVSRVLGWKKGDMGWDPEPAYFEKEEDLKDFVYNPFCGANLSKYLIAAGKLEGTTLVFLKPCDTYSFNQLTKEHRVKREKTYIIGVGCHGTLKAEKVLSAGIKGIEDALQAAYPDWSVRRAFTAQIIINHVQARDGEKIDNMQQAMDRAVENGVKNLVVQPTHLMHGAEYDEMMEMIDEYKDQFESVAVAEPLLGEVGADATEINADKEAVATAITTEAVAAAGYDDAAAAAADGTAFVFMGHGTSHTAKISYSQMQMTMQTLGYDNVFIGTVEGEPEDTACEAVIEKIKEAGYTKVVLRPLMVVAGDHANNDMAGDDEDSWLSQFKAADCFDSVDTQIAGLGEIGDIQQLYIDHAQAAIDSLNG